MQKSWTGRAAAVWMFGAALGVTPSAALARQDPAPKVGAPAAPAPLTLEQQVVLVYGAPGALVGLAATWTQYTAEAVFLASRLTGGQRLVTSGTLTQTTPGQLEFRYSAAPKDRLKVVMLDGTEVLYHVTKFQGNLTVDATTFLAGGHELAVRVSVPKQCDLELGSLRVPGGPLRFDGTQRSTAKGTMTFDGREVTVDARASGTYSFESGSGGVDSQSDLKTEGTLESNGVVVSLAERWQTHLISGRRKKRSGIGSVQETVSDYVRHVDSTWKAGATEAALRSVVVRTAFLDGVPATTDARYWKAEGALIVDGAPRGEVAIIAALNQLRLVVATAPEPIVLQQWTLTTPR